MASSPITSWQIDGGKWKQRQTFVSKVISLLFNMLSSLVIAFLPRSKRLLISWLQSPSAVILEPQENKVWHCFHCSPIYLPWSDGTGCHDLFFECCVFKPALSPSSFTFIKRLFSSSSLSAIGWCHLHIWGYWYSPGNLDSSLCFIQLGIFRDVLCI